MSVGDWTIEVAERRKIVVARGGHASSYIDAFQDGLRHAQQGLDLISMQGKGNMSIRQFDDEHITWWPDVDGLVARVTSISQFPMSCSASGTARDLSGRPLQSPKPPDSSWHESYRYFRLSQATDDLFDAYRNAYLALESVLSDIAPQNSGEREGDWFKRALRAAEPHVDLSDHVAPETTDPIGALYKEHYVGTRSAMSHAKSGRSILLPRNEAERQAVATSLLALVGLYLRIAEKHFKTRRLAGGVTSQGFQLMAKPTLDKLMVYVSDDDSALDPTSSAIAPRGGSVVALPVLHDVEVEGPMVITKRASSVASAMLGVPFVRRVVGATVEGVVMLSTVLEGPLVLGSAAVFEAVIGVRGENARQPRGRYPY